MVQPTHSKLINATAREILTPIGVQQKGQSRLWFDDHGWWLTLVEFQPSNWSRGTYLNVGVNWLWIDRDYFAFDEGYRVKPFIAFQTEEQFKSEIHRVVSKAAEKIQRYRKSYQSVESVARLVSRKRHKDEWALYHAAVASGLCGHSDQSIKFFKELIQKPCQADWHRFLNQRAMQLIGMSQDASEFRRYINGLIAGARDQLHLKPWEPPCF